MSVRLEVTLDLDLELLMKQKLFLVNSGPSDEVEGLLGILDKIQDEIVAQKLATEREVFGSATL